MVLAIGALLGCVATLLALAIRRSLTRTPHCGWCATASNWPTSQHGRHSTRDRQSHRPGDRRAAPVPIDPGRLG
ncbi:hypothetical protein AB0953_05180 [Streptomyces sp. NPDC046866]|uniref:hypothetical protein n=1 Tax=Streptomyces sp. NPDC046866 TaxID=3154921 RepID=UPI003456FA3C